MWRSFFLFLMFLSLNAQAQFLPDNKTLNSLSLERWMKSAADMAPVVESIDAMHSSDQELQKFDELSAIEQDTKIHDFLAQKNQWSTAEQIAKQYGWKSPGEFRRFSTKLGNAIAAYFSKKDQEGLTADQIKQVREKMDPAVLAVPESDIVFVQQHEKQLQGFIQAYAR
jgi:phosphoribulokinase